ncbi:hypothetical protein PVAP13_2NG640002 [Panicum virgatum]|uniref:Uncharacterized protein n=1 Tax=Panicum virgatum TaxID=38727 RepID=A0A8T0VVA4_PANVG|nr:hypothetical protein PVAP13_2NG640002 [Panicum virgatum]
MSILSTGPLKNAWSNNQSTCAGEAGRVPARGVPSAASATMGGGVQRSCAASRAHEDLPAARRWRSAGAVGYRTRAESWRPPSASEREAEPAAASAGGGGGGRRPASAAEVCPRRRVSTAKGWGGRSDAAAGQGGSGGGDTGERWPDAGWGRGVSDPQRRRAGDRAGVEGGGAAG